jgi:hypothetical protein
MAFNPHYMTKRRLWRGNVQEWFYVTTDDALTVSTAGYFAGWQVWVGDIIDVVIVDFIDPTKRTTTSRIELQITAL